MFGDRLKEARKNANMTLDELAEKYNKAYSGKLSKGTLSKYENSLGDISLKDNIKS